MEDVKRGRGRPKGSQTNDDAPLMAVARLLADDLKLAPKTAMRRVFRGGSWGASSEEASIHRWQGKWKTDGAVYMQRVQEERAAAEHNRREREVALQARRADPRSMWEIAAELRATGQLPGWIGGSNAWDAFALHRETMRNALPTMGSFADYRLPAVMAGHVTATDLFAQARQASAAIGDALQAHRSAFNNPEVQGALRRMNEIGRPLSEAYEMARHAKLMGEF